MVEIFKNDEVKYGQWLRANSHGYIYNDFGSTNPAYTKLHEADCTMLHNLGGGTRRTSVRKVCSPNLSELIIWLKENRGPEGEGYTPCQYCRPL
jgi:hypothetical protein